MRINAYILAADPAWIEPSLLSYYDRVGRVVVSYDADSRGWTGAPIDVAACLRRLRAIDRDGKFDYRPGAFALDRFHARPMEGETYQRQRALDQAGTDADWVVQLDSDEVMGDADRFFEALRNADRAGEDGFDYPSRWFYRRIAGPWYLERCRRGWRRSAGYPGAMAVRAGARLTVARQGVPRRYRVDFASRSTDPSYPRDARIDEVVAPSQAILHFSWTRADAVMADKANISGHARDFDWTPQLDKWRRAGRHPLLASLLSQRERGNLKRHVRPTRVALPTEVTRRLPDGFDCETGDLITAPAAAPALGRAVTA